MSTATGFVIGGVVITLLAFVSIVVRMLNEAHRFITDALGEAPVHRGFRSYPVAMTVMVCGMLVAAYGIIAL